MSLGAVILPDSLNSVWSFFCCELTSVPGSTVPNGTVTVAVPSAAVVTVTVGAAPKSFLTQVPFCFWKITGCLPFAVS